MLRVYIPPMKFFDPKSEEFIDTPGTYLNLEHSLVSISKWETKWKKPFLTEEDKTPAETIDYIRCMTLTQNVDPLIYKAIPKDVMKEIQSYINDTLTATTFYEAPGGEKKAPIRRKITSELVYYWMVAFNIPFDPCQKWHFSRLMTLIRICGEKNDPKKKMSEKDTLQRYKTLNAMRKAKYHTKG